MAGPQYTTCVKKEDYTDYSGWTVAYGGWWEATDYMLHRKLVCLGSVEPGTKPSGAGTKPSLVQSDAASASCAIGRIVSFEPPSSKSFPDNIDNDFSFNILLRPGDAELSDNPFANPGWRSKNEQQALQAVRDGYQGEFLSDQGAPRPHEAGDDDPGYGGLTSEMFFDAERNESGATARGLINRVAWFTDGTVKSYPLDADGGYSVPVLHCECEGSRIRDVFNVADQMPGGGSSCGKHWYTSIACFVLRLLAFPFTTTFIAEAWANARDGNYHDAMDGNGDLKIGDLVLVKGRWAFDAGHKGYNEIHAVATIQKIPEPAGDLAKPFPSAEPDPDADLTKFGEFYEKWCGLASEAPPGDDVGRPPDGMTAAQATIYAAQQRPENHYQLHPDVDGCRPAPELKITAVEPDVIARGDRTMTLAVLGSGFVPGARVALLGGGPVVQTITIQSPSRIDLTILVESDVVLGPREVVVVNPDGASARCDRCLTIVGPDIR